MDALVRVVEDRGYLDAQRRDVAVYCLRDLRILLEQQGAAHQDGDSAQSTISLQEAENMLRALGLNELLASRVSASIYYRYLGDIGCQSLLLFYEQCAHFAKVPSPGLRRTLSRRIYSRYCADGAPCDVMLSQALRMDVASIVVQASSPPPPETFASAADCVFKRMLDGLPRFYESRYARLLLDFLRRAHQRVRETDFVRLRVLGEGGFGKVHAIKKLDTGAIYALKEMSKIKIIKKKRVETLLNEANIMKRCHHPFITGLHHVIQDDVSMYFVIDLMVGGELKYHLKHYKKKITREVAQFWAACMVLALEYLHKNNIVHRDIKIANALLDEDGFVHLTDFGLSVQLDESEPLTSCCGTPGYIAPEMYLGPHWDRKKSSRQKTNPNLERKNSLTGQLFRFGSAVIGKSSSMSMYGGGNAKVAAAEVGDAAPPAGGALTPRGRQSTPVELHAFMGAELPSFHPRCF